MNANAIRAQPTDLRFRYALPLIRTAELAGGGTARAKEMPSVNFIDGNSRSCLFRTVYISNGRDSSFLLNLFSKSDIKSILNILQSSKTGDPGLLPSNECLIYQRGRKSDIVSITSS